jgi:hypothetical protein
VQIHIICGYSKNASRLTWGIASLRQTTTTFFSVISLYIFFRYLVAINFGSTSSKDDYRAAFNISIPAEASVAMTTANGLSFKKDDKVDTTKLELGPQQGVVLTWDYVIKETM